MRLENWQGFFPIELDTKRLSANYALRTERSASNLSLKDSCALSDQMSFVPTFPWGRLVLAAGYRGCYDKNEIAIFVFSVTAKDFPPEMLLPELSRTYFTFFPPLGHPTPW